MNLDDHITGAFAPNAPFNQIDEPQADFENLEECFEAKNSDAFYSILFELRNEINALKNAAGLCQNQYFKKKLNNIYQKL